MNTVARRFVVHGRVQGVGFRYFVVSEAESLGIVGWVRNLPGGEVEGVVEGEEPQVAELLVRVNEGPPMSRVTNVDVSEIEVTGRYRGFGITR